MDFQQLIKDNPNDADLGNAVKKAYSKSEFIQIPTCYYRDKQGRKVYAVDEMQLEFEHKITELIEKS